jgi:uncharacterized membrane protein
MWAAYSVLAAVGWATSDACAKRVMNAGGSGAGVIFARNLIAIPLLLPLLAFGIPDLDRTFWLLHLPWLPLETTALYLYMHAIRTAPLSLTVPFLALTPLFLVVTGWLFLGEQVTPLSLVGIVLSVVGSYTVNLAHARRDWLGPFKAMLREPGTRAMLAVAFIYSLTSLCGKVLVAHSSATYFAVHFVIVMAVITLPAGLHARRRERGPGRPRRGWLAASGVAYGVSMLGHMFALQTVPVVAYMIAIKRLSGSFGVLYGALLFRERELAIRLAGSLVMVAGCLLILLGAG